MDGRSASLGLTGPAPLRRGADTPQSGQYGAVTAPQASYLIVSGPQVAARHRLPWR